MPFAKKGRPREDGSPPPAAKRSRSEALGPSLLSFSDDVLFLILRHLTSSGDLLRLSETCRRLARICADQALWITVDTRGEAPLSLRGLRKLLPFLHERTRSVTVQGFLRSPGNRTRESMSPSILQAIGERCPQLEEFALEECFVDASKIPISLLPSSIKILRISNSEVVNIPDKTSYFNNIHTEIPGLTTIDLSDGGWVSNHSLMAICKCEELREIDLRGCFRIGECFAYTALAARFGFRKLQRADLRNTSAGDSEVPCFGRLPEITHLYLGHTSAELSEQSEEKIGDRGLLSLVAFSGDSHVSKLQVLSLTHTNTSDKILPKLASSLPLKLLDVSGTKVTQVGVNSVMTARPECVVVV